MRILKILGIIVVIIVLLLLAIPILFQGNIKSIVQKTINKQVNAQVNFGDIDLSLFRSFPKASVIVEDLSVINVAPFEGDTLVFTKSLSFNMSISQLFKKDKEAIQVDEINVREALVTITIDSLGQNNYDIAKEKAATTTQDTTGGFDFKIEHYAIKDSRFKYQDATSNMIVQLTDIQHEGDGVVNGNQMTLATKTKTNISLDMDGTKYLNNNTLDLDADLLLDLIKSRYTFQENTAHINGLPLSFDGYIQLNEANTEVALTFENPGSDFKEFLALVPKSYTQNLDGVKTSGNFKIKGAVNGIVDEVYIPKFKIDIASQNASFQYPDLPKEVDNIVMDVEVENTSGLLKDTFVTIGKMTFRIDQDTFAANGTLRNVTENMLVAMKVNGTLNLSNLKNAYPVPLEEGQQFNGTLKADLTTNFAMDDLEKERYQKISTSGVIGVRDFRYSSADIPRAVAIAQASVNFTPSKIQLDQMTATTGSSDITASGIIDNLLGYMFADQDLKGVFAVKSNKFVVSDFMLPEDDSSEENPDTETQFVHIPAFLDARLNFEVAEVIYDNLSMKNTRGTVIIKDETATLENVTTGLFDGTIAFNGRVATKGETPTFDMGLDMSKINIAQSFASLDLLKSLAPVAKGLQGLLNTKLKLAGNLKNDLTPQLNSLKGDAVTEILNAKVNPNQAPLLSSLNQKLNFINLEDLNLKDIQTQLTFDNGKVSVKPFDFEAKGIKAKVSGSHGLDMNMDYQAVLEIPAKYLGSEVGSLMAGLSDQEISEMKIPLPVQLNGSFNSPVVKVNTKTAIGDLTQRLVARQKEVLKDKVKSEVKDKLGDQIKGKSGDILGGLLGGAKKEIDTTKAVDTQQKTKKPEESVKEVAKDALNNLFGKKKK